jgi:two-component system response regulator YesN
VALKQLKNQNQRYFFLEKLEAEVLPVQSVIFEFEKQLLDAIRQGDVNNVLYIYDSFVSKFNANNDIKTSIFKKLLDETFILMARMLHELEINYQQVSPIIETKEVIELIEQGRLQLLEIVQHVQVRRNNHARGMLHSAKEFMEF